MAPDTAAPEQAAAEVAAPIPARAALRVWPVARRAAFLSGSLYLFMFALMLMQHGARALEPLVNDWLHVAGPLNSLGFGWLSAYAILSGSPVAATALTLFNSALLTPLETFAMIAGSRLGASFVVLLIGLVYAVRGHERTTSLAMGILSLVVTGTVQTAALILGAFLLIRNAVPPISSRVALGLTMAAQRLVGGTADHVAERATSVAGAPLVFVAGLAVMLVSFTMFDRGLPPLTLGGTALPSLSRTLYRPSVMLLLGMGVTLVSMSVSVSLSLLVPLSARGYVRRENVVPYIMGANITTFIDTLLAAMFIANMDAVRIVFTQMIAIFIVSALVLVVAIRPYQKLVLAVVSWTTTSNRNLALFLLVLFAVPLVLLAM